LLSLIIVMSKGSMPAGTWRAFYALSIQPTLFGEPSLLRSWGRIGCRGQQRIHVFEEEGEADDLLLQLIIQKRKKGYRPCTSCGNLQMPCS
jgi:predicted DNA-binding WGR domain protein